MSVTMLKTGMSLKDKKSRNRTTFYDISLSRAEQLSTNDFSTAYRIAANRY